MNSKTKVIIIAAIAVYALGFLSGVFAHRAWTTPWIQQTDTVTVFKTATSDSLPQSVVTAPAPERIPPVVVPSSKVERDTADTTQVRIRPDVSVVTGTLSGGLTYQATLTGVQPSITQLKVTFPERIITQNAYKPYKGWMLSATADIATFATPQFTAFSKVAVETSYNTGPLHLALQGGIVSSPSSGSWHTYPYLGARITLDIFRLR